MQSVNDDMDELFRRAAENYNLNSSGADWNVVQERLKTDRKKPLFDRRFLWLLLLLPFSFLCTNYFSEPGERTALQEAKSEREGATGTGKTASATNLPSKNESHLRNADANSGTQTNNRSNTALEGAVNNSDNGIARQSSGKAEVRDVTVNLSQVSTARNQTKETARITTAAGKVRAGEQQSGNYIPSVTTNDYSLRKPAEAFAIRSMTTSGDYLANAQERKIVNKEEPKACSVRLRHFYAGISAGLDLTLVKLQRTEGLSTSLGFVAGYKFGERWRLETGLLHDTKYYYTSGEYFSTKQIYMPPNSSVTDVTGSCSMWELPVIARYKFNPKSAWSAAAGVTSYYMTSEQYRYTYYYQLTGTKADYSKSYSSSSTSLAAALHLSAMYEKPLGRFGNLRLESYLRVPLKGVGIGSLSLQSIGLQASFTRDLF